MEKLLLKLRDYLRGSGWLLIAAVGITWLMLFAPAKIGVLIWIITKIFACAFAGYWVDRICYPYLRPHLLSESQEKNFRIVTRAIIVGACIVAGGHQA